MLENKERPKNRCETGGRQGLAKANEKKKRKNLFKERKKMEEK